MKSTVKSTSMILVVAAMLLSALTFAVAGDSAPKSRLDVNVAKTIADSATDVCVAADALDEAWLNQDALHVLEASGRTDADVLWREARSRVNIGETYPEDDPDAEPFFIQGLEEAEKAVELAPNNADANLMIATAAGRVALLRGIPGRVPARAPVRRRPAPRRSPHGLFPPA